MDAGTLLNHPTPGFFDRDQRNPSPLLESFTIQTTPEQDVKIEAAIKKLEDAQNTGNIKDYQLRTYNCATVARELLNAGGLNVPPLWGALHMLNRSRLILKLLYLFRFCARRRVPPLVLVLLEFSSYEILS